MPDRPDPAGIFDSDTHRRVLASLGEDTLSDDALMTRLALDTALTAIPDLGDASAQRAAEVLKDLEAEGYASNAGGDWKRLKAGTDKLNGPIANPPPDLEGDALKFAEEASRKQQLAQEARAGAGYIKAALASINELEERIVEAQKAVDAAEKEGLEF